MFKTFPEFSKLTLSDRRQYEALIQNYPPIYDISFIALMTWWNSMDTMSVSLLNNNIVIPYWLPGDDKHSGLSLIGSDKVDESICTIFDYLRERGEPVRLVNVPEFVVSNVKYPAMFKFTEQRVYHEYILPISGFYPIKNMTGYRRRKVERQLSRADGRGIVTRSLDLSLQKNRDVLWNATLQWQPKGINNYGKIEQDSMQFCIEHAEALGVENVCLYVGDELYGFCLYQLNRDKNQVQVKHIKATHVTTLGFELIAYFFAKWFAEQGVLYVNVCADHGLMRLRMFMLTLGPHNFFRKYKVEPA
jgi:hypothetical protein